MKLIRLILIGVFLLLLCEAAFYFFQNQCAPVFYAPQDRIYQIAIKISNGVTDKPEEKAPQQTHYLNDMFWKFGPTLIGSLLATASAILVGYVTNLRNLRKERIARIRAFHSSMTLIRHRAALVDYDKMGDFYGATLPIITQNAELVRDDIQINHMGEFNEHLAAIYKWDGVEIEDPENQANIIQSIELLIGFVERNHIK